MHVFESTFANNSAGANGGAILLQQGSRLVSKDSTKIIRNRAPRGAGGSIACEDCDNVTLFDTVLDGNVAFRERTGCPSSLKSFFLNNTRDGGKPCACNSDSYSSELNSDGLSAMICMPCPERSTSPPGSTSILNCTCSENSFLLINTVNGKRECAKCPEGSISSSASTSVDNCSCVADNYYLKGMICAECGENKTRKKSQTTCQCRMGGFGVSAKPGFYLQNPARELCAKCPRNANCSLKDGATISEISPKPGFWRSSPESDKFYNCMGPHHHHGSARVNAEARCCPGTLCYHANTSSTAADVLTLSSSSSSSSSSLLSWQNTQCGKNYHGILCALCEENYVLSLDGLCTPCDPPNLILAVGLFLIACVLLAVCVGCIISALNTDPEEGEEDKTKRAGSGLRRGRSVIHQFASSNAKKEAVESSFASALVHHILGHATICISWMQILSAITVSADAVAWPETFVLFTNSLGVVNLDIASLLPAADCSLILTNFQSTMLHLLSPFAVVLSILLGTAVAIQRTKLKLTKSKYLREHARRFQQNFASKIIINIVLLMYPSVSKRVFQSFRCFEVEGSLYLEADFAVECYGRDHTRYIVLSVIYLFVFVVGVPAILLWDLWRHRKHLHDTRSAQHKYVRNRLGSVYEDYEENMWFCELFVIIHKLMLAGVLAIMAPHSPLQLFLGLLICLGFLLLFVRLAPYNADGHDLMSFVAYCSLTLTLLIGALKSTHEYEDGNDDVRGSSSETVGHQWQHLDDDVLGKILIVINFAPYICLVSSSAMWAVFEYRKKQEGRDNDGSGRTLVARKIAPVTKREMEKMNSGVKEDGETQHDRFMSKRRSRTSAASQARINASFQARIKARNTLTADKLHESFVESERQLQREQSKRQEASRRHTMQRVKARAALKKSKRLKHVEVFQGLSDAAIGKLVDRMKETTFAPGEFLVRQGELAKAFFIISAGNCDVIVDGKHVNALHTHEHFGESAVFVAARMLSSEAQDGRLAAADEERRNASVVANSEAVHVLSLDLVDLKKLFQDGTLDAQSFASSMESARNERRAVTAAGRVWRRARARQQRRPVPLPPGGLPPILS